MRELIRALSPTAWAAVAGGAVASMIILVIVILSWGQSRYDAGAADADARWQAAGRKLEQQIAEAGTVASRQEADRIERHTAQVAKEKEKIDEAVAAGSSPLDALFGL